MTSLTDYDLRFVLSRVPKDVLGHMKRESLFLAGGFIRSTIAHEAVNDIDLFGGSEENLGRIALQLTVDRNGKLHKTPNAYTVLSRSRIPVQFITRWLYSEATTLIESFDFTIAQSVIWFDQTDDKWKSFISDQFYSDLAAKRLT